MRRPPAAAYLPRDYTDFGAAMMSDGVNATFGVGHHVFSVGDIMASWPQGPAPQTAGVAATALLASLLFPDRVAWFLFSAPAPQQMELEN